MEIGSERVGFPLPAYGKTGTSNRHTNSSYVGVIPGPKEKSDKLCLEEGYVIAGYVGYDDNRPMKGERIVIYGSSGALPLWIDTANAVAESPAFKKNLQIADLAFDIQSVFTDQNPGLEPILISTVTGLPAGAGDYRPEKGVRVLADVERKGDRLVLKRVFEPALGVSNDE
jgi:membrane peptidoglycan carboxypeptidase